MNQRERTEYVRDAATDIVVNNGVTVEKSYAYEVKPGLYRVDIVTPGQGGNRVGLFRIDDQGEVVAAS